MSTPLVNTTRPLLTAGDRVALVSPSGPATPDHLEYAVLTLESWGLRVDVGEHALDHSPCGYLAGDDAARRSDLVDAWTDPDTVAVIALRGGYGAMRLLDGINFPALPKTTRDGRPKLLTGSSDITALHQAWAFHLGVPTLFSPMPGNAVFHNSEAIRTDVQKWLFEPWARRSLTGALAGPASELGACTLVAGTSAGVLTGGNLSLLAASIGACEFHLPGGKIAILEDVDEEPYRLDNLMLQLQRVGWFSAASAIVLGSWEGCGDPERVEATITQYVVDHGVPVVWNLGFGHDPHAATVPLGVMATLNAPREGVPSLNIH